MNNYFVEDFENIEIKSFDNNIKVKNIYNESSESESDSQFYDNFMKIFGGPPITSKKEEADNKIDEKLMPSPNSPEIKYIQINNCTNENSEMLENVTSIIFKEKQILFEMKPFSNINVINNSNEEHLDNNNNNTQKNENLKESDGINLDKIKNKKSKIFYIEKTNDLLRTIYPETFKIFHKGNDNKIERKLINDVIKNTNFSPYSGSKKNKKKKARKYNADNIRKKIKSRFLKNLKNTLNERLKKADSKYLFNFLPQNFISNIGKKDNRGILQLSFKELFSKDFSNNKDKTNECNIKKLEDNISAINYLENNLSVSQKSNYGNFKKMKYYEIYNEYLKSKEFEMEISQLKKEENDMYIKLYIELSFNLNDFFHTDKSKIEI